MRPQLRSLAARDFCWLVVVGALVAIALGSDAGLAQSASAAKPKVPPGTDPGGIAIALIGFGVDYTDAEIAPRLARDGEGDIIGWDLVDGDNKPYGAALQEPDPRADRGTTSLAKLMLAAYSRARLVPIRIKPDAAASVMMQAVGFIARTPARIVALPLLGGASQGLDALLPAARLADMILFVVPQGEDAASTVPKLDNVLRVLPAAQAGQASAAARDAVDAWIAPRGVAMLGARREAPPANAAEAVALATAATACAQHGRTAGGAAAKAALIALATEVQAYPGLKVIDPQCLYGGQRN